MDPRKIIRDAADNDEYTVTEHCLAEMDKDGISIGQSEHVMKEGKIVKRNPRNNRYTLKKEDIMICAEIDHNNCVTIITAGRVGRGRRQ